MKISGEVAVVMGAAREGIGKGYCKALLDKGAKVCFADILEVEGKATEEEFRKEYGVDRVFFVKCDVRKQGDLHNVFAAAKSTFGGDVTIGSYNAAIINEFDFEPVVDINVNGLMRFTTAALNVMSKEKGGKGGVIVNTASCSSLYPDEWGPVYNATKHAVLGYTRSWACKENVAVTGIRFNMIAPWNVDTHLVDFVRQGKILHAESKNKNVEDNETISISRIGDVFIQLVEDDTMNGETIEMHQNGNSRRIAYYDRAAITNPRILKF